MVNVFFVSTLWGGFEEHNDVIKPALTSNPNDIQMVPRGENRVVSRDSGIPKNIHQIWKSDLIPAVFQDNIRGLVAHNRPPEWTYYFWTDRSGYELINNTFSRLLKRYKQADGVLKGDILRLVVLYQYGGAYFNLDTASVKPLDPYMETHDCTLVTDPPEHSLNQEAPTRPLMITNSAMLCKPFNWFILHLIRQLENQPPSCNHPIFCTGPLFITKIYENFQATNKSVDLPVIDDYRLFEDMVDHTIQGAKLEALCREPFPLLKHEWSLEICRNWIKRGREKRNISEKAFTYHTWFHTYHTEQQESLHAGFEKRIKELVPNVKLYYTAR